MCFRRNAHCAGPGSVSSDGDRRLGRSSGRVPDVRPSSPLRERLPLPHPERHERSPLHLCYLHRLSRDDARLFLLAGYDLNSSAVDGEQRTLVYHRYVEALKFANGLKKHVRDPKFSPGVRSARWREIFNVTVCAKNVRKKNPLNRKCQQQASKARQ